MNARLLLGTSLPFSRVFPRRIMIPSSFFVLLVTAAVVSTPMAAATIDGKIVKIDEGTVTIKIDSKFVPHRNDKVEIGTGLPGLDFFDAAALGTVREVNGDLAVVKIFATMDKIENFHIARITSEGPRQPDKRQTESAGTATGKGARVVKFDELKVGDLASDALARFGIASIRSDPEAVRNGEGQPLIIAASKTQVLPAGRKNLLSAGWTHTFTSALTFTFTQPLRRFELVRIGVIGDGSLPKWHMVALDPKGRLIVKDGVVVTVGENNIGRDKQSKRFSIAGENIGSVRLESDAHSGVGGTLGTNNALPIAELVLEPDTSPVGKTTDTIRIPANEVSIDTGIMLREGDTLAITASGTIEAAGPAEKRSFYHAVPPNGRNQRFDYLPDPSLPALSLVGMTDNGPVFFVGNSMRLKVGAKTGTGYLRLGINDDDVSDNRGEWRAQITIGRATPSEADGTKPRARPSNAKNNPTPVTEVEEPL